MTVKEKKKVLVMVPCREQDYEAYRNSVPEYDFIFERKPTTEQISEANIIIGEPSIRRLKEATALEWLQVTYAGVDYYMNGDYFPEGVTLTNMSGAFGPAISEYVLAMIMTLMKKLHLYRDNQKLALWKDMGEEQSLCDKTVVIVGAGDIGCHVARLTKLFDCKNIGIRRVNRKMPEYFDEMHTLDSLNELLPRADILVLALPATSDTVGLMTKERINLLRKEAILVNVGRGVLVDTDALTEALMEERIGGAALDVTSPEPLPKEHPLWQCPNAIITPHITGGSFHHLKKTWDRITDIAVNNLKLYSKGEELKNQVDFKTGYRKTP